MPSRPSTTSTRRSPNGLRQILVFIIICLRRIFSSLKRSGDLEDDLDSFSAVCALFGANLADSLGSRPIGMVDISWGETAIEAWASPDVLATCDVPPVPW